MKILLKIWIDYLQDWGSNVFLFYPQVEIYFFNQKSVYNFYDLKKKNLKQESNQIDSRREYFIERIKIFWYRRHSPELFTKKITRFRQTHDQHILKNGEGKEKKKSSLVHKRFSKNSYFCGFGEFGHGINLYFLAIHVSIRHYRII